MCLAAATAAAQDLSLTLSLPRENYIRGTQVPVEGLVATLTIANSSNVAVLVPKPVIHPEAAPGMAASAAIRWMDPEGGDGLEIPRVAGLAAPFVPTEVENLRVEGNGQVQVSINIGRHYLIRRPGTYEMSIRYREMESNTVSFTVLPLRKLTLPADLIIDRIREVEWGDPDYNEMFYVVRSPRAWDEVVLVQRIGKNKAFPMTLTGIGYLAKGTMPEIMIVEPGVYVLLYREKTGKGWVACKVDCSKDPFAVSYKRYAAGDKPDVESAAGEL